MTRAGLTFLLSAVFLAGGAQVAFAVLDPTAQSVGTTGAQQASSCPTPRLSGLPKTPKFTNATIHFKLTNMTAGESYTIMAGLNEVLGGGATGSTVKDKFLLPDQGVKNKKIFITAVIDSDKCDNAPWKLQKPIAYKTTTPAAPATPATPGATPGAPVAGKVPAATPPKTAAKPAQPLKFQKPLTQRLPDGGPPPSRRAWLTPMDGGARLDQKLSPPELSRLEQRTDKANSSNALLGLGIVGGLFAVAVVGGFMMFRRRDDVLFERAQLEQLKHLQEADPGVGAPTEDPEAPLPPEEAPFADEEPPTERLSAIAHANGGSNGAPTPPQNRAEVEAELQRILNEAGLEAGLEGILGDARAEAERHGVALDPDLMLHALSEEIDGFAKLSDSRREELRAMFAGIIAQEAQQTHAAAPESAETVPTQ